MTYEELKLIRAVSLDIYGYDYGQASLFVGKEYTTMLSEVTLNGEHFQATDPTECYLEPNGLECMIIDFVRFIASEFKYSPQPHQCCTTSNAQQEPLNTIPTMTNYSLNLNLVKLPGAQYVKREDGRVCIAIPTSTLFVTEKGCYLNLAIWEQANQQYSSHLVKQSFSKEYNAKLTDEQRRAIPIIGNMKPMVASVTTTSATALETPPLTQTTQSTNDQPPIEQPPIEQPPIADDLPF